MVNDILYITLHSLFNYIIQRVKSFSKCNFFKIYILLALACERMEMNYVLCVFLIQTHR